MLVRALLISLLVVSAIAHGQGNIPIARDTSKASKNLLLTSKMLQKQIDAIRQTLDSNYVQWGIDTTNAAATDTAYLTFKYADANYVVLAIVRDAANAGLATAIPISDSSFYVEFGGVTTWVYQWQTTGIKKKE